MTLKVDYVSVMVISVVNFMQVRFTWGMDLWACLWELSQLH